MCVIVFFACICLSVCVFIMFVCMCMCVFSCESYSFIRIYVRMLGTFRIMCLCMCVIFMCTFCTYYINVCLCVQCSVHVCVVYQCINLTKCILKWKSWSLKVSSLKWSLKGLDIIKVLSNFSLSYAKVIEVEYCKSTCARCKYCIHSLSKAIK